MLRSQKGARKKEVNENRQTSVGKPKAGEKERLWKKNSSPVYFKLITKGGGCD